MLLLKIVVDLLLRLLDQARPGEELEIGWLSTSGFVAGLLRRALVGVHFACLRRCGAGLREDVLEVPVLGVCVEQALLLLGDPAAIHVFARIVVCLAVAGGRDWTPVLLGCAREDGRLASTLGAVLGLSGRLATFPQGQVAPAGS